MQASSLYAKLKNYFPNDIQNINLPQLSNNYLDQSHALSFIITTSLPHLSLEQIHNLCRNQQKNVMDKILEIKHIDLYQQIANVCPSQKDLKNMPTDQVNMRINQFTAQMALQERMKEEQEQQMGSYEESQGQVSSSEQQMIHPMQIDEVNYQNIHQVKGLHNIFQEEYNIHLPWNEMCIYDLN